MRHRIGEPKEEREILTIDEIIKDLKHWKRDMVCYKHVEHVPGGTWVVYEIGNVVVPDVPVYSEPRYGIVK